MTTYKVTARTFPFNDDGTFASEPAEFAHKVASRFGLTRAQTREVIQAFVFADDRSRAQYDAWVAEGRPR